MKPRFIDVQDRLRFVGMARDDYDLARFPDFMIIGPQRTGTTWLHENLIEHPQVFMPAQKELYYFNCLKHPEKHPIGLPQVGRDLGWYLDQFQPSAAFLAARQTECMARFSEPYAPTTVGEATATYAAALAKDVIREILVLNPDIKILTMVRNPIDRAWSHAKKDLSGNAGRPLEDVPEKEWLAFFQRWYQLRCGHFSEYWPTWTALVPENNLFTGRFVDVTGDPAGLLAGAYRFLGIAADAKYIGELSNQRFNPTADADIPPVLRAKLEELFGDEVERLKNCGLI